MFDRVKKSSRQRHSLCLNKIDNKILYCTKTYMIVVGIICKEKYSIKKSDFK